MLSTQVGKHFPAATTKEFAAEFLRLYFVFCFLALFFSARCPDNYLHSKVVAQVGSRQCNAQNEVVAVAMFLAKLYRMLRGTGAAAAAAAPT